MDSETICHYCGEKLPHEKCSEVKKPELGLTKFTKKLRTGLEEYLYFCKEMGAPKLVELCKESLKACVVIDRMATYQDYKDKAVKRSKKKQKNQAKTINFLVAKLKVKDEEIAKLIDALTRIDTWVKAYPLDIFPEPDLKKAAKVLKAAGMTLDSISASNMRHVLVGIQKIIEGEAKDV